mmetsp:Transcript_90283/g.176762  ORF Transcript_90283/g.176762 Transcript_90283/m.176762 type:complete len:268 (-) Transcript_90283:37-840(-)
MAMRVHDVLQRQALLANYGQVAHLLLQDGVNEHGLFRLLTSEEVRVGRGLWVEKLREDEALRGLEQARHIRRGHLLHQPLPHGAAGRAAPPELQVRVVRELLRGLQAVAVLPHKPQQQHGPCAIPARALQHDRPRQGVEGLHRGLHLLVGRHGGRAGERTHLHVLHAGVADCLGVEVRVLRAIDIHPRLEARRDGRRCGGRQAPAEAHVAGDVRRLDAQLRHGELRLLRSVAFGADRAHANGNRLHELRLRGALHTAHLWQGRTVTK